MESLSRRDLLRLAALGAAIPAAGALAGPAAALPRANQGITSLKALGKSVDGTLLLPGNAAFAAKAQPWDTYADFGPPGIDPLRLV